MQNHSYQNEFDLHGMKIAFVAGIQRSGGGEVGREFGKTNFGVAEGGRGERNVFPSHLCPSAFILPKFSSSSLPPSPL